MATYNSDFKCLIMPSSMFICFINLELFVCVCVVMPSDEILLLCAALYLKKNNNKTCVGGESQTRDTSGYSVKCIFEGCCKSFWYSYKLRCM